MPELNHIAIIMDGNGRWAQLRKRPRIFGHIKGARVAKKIITYCAERNLKNLTMYAFSSENWLRPQDEVSFLMRLLRRYLQKETNNLVRQNIKFDVIGEISRLPEDIAKAIAHTKQKTNHCTGLNLVFAISYGSRQEITTGIKELCRKAQAGEIDITSLTEEDISKSLWTAGMPDPDLVIRTSGEQRLSNFLMWQCAYSELYFSNTLWPDFTSHDLELAIESFDNRDRRFGRVQDDSQKHETAVN